MAQFTGSRLTCQRGHRLVFTGLDFTVAAGDALVLLGPNGSGKSSLLRMMAGLLRPLAGSMLWDGVAVADDPDHHRGRLHYVGHLDAVKPVLTAQENLAFWAGLAGVADPQARARQALAAFEVPHIADVPGRYLSAGQKRRVNLVRVLAAEAPLWLLDEPSVALDRTAIACLEQAIARHRAAGGLVVLSTHAEITLTAARSLHLDAFTPQRRWHDDDADESEDGDYEVA